MALIFVNTLFPYCPVILLITFCQTMIFNFSQKLLILALEDNGSFSFQSVVNDHTSCLKAPESYDNTK